MIRRLITNKPILYSKICKGKTNDDLYLAVGKIIKNSQEWEKEFKKLCKLNNIISDEDTKVTLNVMINKLLEKQLVSEKEFNDLKIVIEHRNFINHQFFLNSNNYSMDTKQEYLNDVNYLIFEATDIVLNKIDKKRGFSGNRPTLFDKK